MAQGVDGRRRTIRARWGAVVLAAALPVAGLVGTPAAHAGGVGVCSVGENAILGISIDYLLCQVQKAAATATQAVRDCLNGTTCNLPLNQFLK